MRRLALGVTVSTALLLMPGFALAEDEPGLVHPSGMSFSVGAGVADFTGQNMRDMTGVAGAWDARFVFGTRATVGFEAAYIGTAQTIDALGLDGEAMLVGSGFEADVRLHLVTGAWQPYVFGGAGWRHYQLAADTNTSNVSESDDVFEVPLGVGMSYTRGDIVFDARATYRSAGSENLVPIGTVDQRSLDSYAFLAHVGYEF